MVDLKVGVIGVGNCGGNIARLAHDRLGIEAIAINTSKDDLAFHTDHIYTCLIGANGEGVGKDRTAAKMYIRSAITSLISDKAVQKLINESDVIFIPSSCGGGTGSGISLLLTQALIALDQQRLMKEEGDIGVEEKFFIPIGVAPVTTEATGSQLNFTDYMKDLLEAMPHIGSYMLYDNSRCDNKRNQDEVIEAVNQRVVDDISVIRGDFVKKSNNRSIDTQSMRTILRAGGRLVVSYARGFKDSSISKSDDIENLLISDLQTSPHMLIDRNRLCSEFGVIANLSDNSYNCFNMNIPLVSSLTGRPTDSFENITINDSQMCENEVYLIVSGLPYPESKVIEVNKLLEEIAKEEEARIQAAENAAENLGDLFNSSGINTLRSNRGYHKTGRKLTGTKDILSMDDIFKI